MFAPGTVAMVVTLVALLLSGSPFPSVLSVKSSLPIICIVSATPAVAVPLSSTAVGT